MGNQKKKKAKKSVSLDEILEKLQCAEKEYYDKLKELDLDKFLDFMENSQK